jgi:predicted DNA-binding transcriptional regulator AlpA
LVYKSPAQTSGTSQGPVKASATCKSCEKGTKDVMKPAKKNSPVVIPQAVDPILTAAQVGERLQISPGCVYELTRRRCKNPLPYVKVGKYLRFRLSHIESWLDRLAA